MRNDEEFNQRIQHIGRGLENLAGRINLTRQMLRRRAQLMREMVAKPVVKTWQESSPRPLGLEILGRAPPQSERAEAKQAEPRPILPGLWDLITTKPKIETKQAEPQLIEQPVEVEERTRYPPEEPRLF
jgi:hypothetical protein